MHTWCVFSRRKIYRGNQGQILQVLSYFAGRGHMHEPNCPRWCGLQYPFVKIGRRPAARPRRRHISRVGKYKYSSCSLVTTVRVVVALYLLSPCLISLLVALFTSRQSMHARHGLRTPPKSSIRSVSKMPERHGGSSAPAPFSHLDSAGPATSRRRTSEARKDTR